MCAKSLPVFLRLSYVFDKLSGWNSLTQPQKQTAVKLEMPARNVCTLANNKVISYKVV